MIGGHICGCSDFDRSCCCPIFKFEMFVPISPTVYRNLMLSEITHDDESRYEI